MKSKKEVCIITVTIYVKLFKGHKEGKKSEYAAHDENERGLTEETTCSQKVSSGLTRDFIPLLGAVWVRGDT